MKLEIMDKAIVNYRAATENDIDFLSQILVNAAAASGVEIRVADLPTHPEIFQYVERFPRKADVGIIAQTSRGVLIGCAWVRLLPTDAHAINEPLPELTMGVLPQYQRIGVGKQLLEELYKAVSATGIPKISLGVHKDNIPAVSLYKQQDWIEDGAFQQYIMMSKRVSDR